MNARGALVTVASFVLLAHARGADAAPVPVVVVADDFDAPLASKLRSELSAAGYQVDSVSAEAGADFSAVATSHGAPVLLRVSARAVDVWIAEPGTTTTEFSERIAPSRTSASDDDAGVLALRAIEAVRADILRMAPSPVVPESAPPASPGAAATPGDAATQPAGTPRAPPSGSRFSASLGPSVLATPGGVGVGGDAALGLSFFATRHVHLDALARVPVVAANVNAPEGSARVGIGVLGGGASFAFTDAESLASPFVGAGMAVGWTHVEGTATPPLVGQSTDLVAAMPYLRLGTSVRLSGRVRARAEGLGAISLSTERIAFVGRPAASVANPLLDASVGLEVLW